MVKYMLKWQQKNQKANKKPYVLLPACTNTSTRTRNAHFENHCLLTRRITVGPKEGTTPIECYFEIGIGTKNKYITGMGWDFEAYMYVIPIGINRHRLKQILVVVKSPPKFAEYLGSMLPWSVSVSQDPYEHVVVAIFHVSPPSEISCNHWTWIMFFQNHPLNTINCEQHA